MVDKRIYDYPSSLAEDPKYYFAVDRVNNATGKISYSNMGKQITTDIEKARTWIFTKIDDDTFSLNTQLFNDSGTSFPLVDGQIIHIPASLTTIPFAWQPSPNPKIKINSGDAIDIHNGIYYSKYGFTGLDRNTLWGQGMYFVYDATLNAMLVYKEGYNSGDSYFGDKNQQAGIYQLDGTTPDATNYPVLNQVLAEEGNGTATPDMADACFVGADDGTYTPLGVVSEGSVKDIDLKVDFTGGFTYLDVTNKNGFQYVSLTGDFDKNVLYERIESRATFYTSSSYGGKVTRISYNLTDVPNYNLSIPSGTQTLSKRYGYCIARVL